LAEAQRPEATRSGRLGQVLIRAGLVQKVEPRLRLRRPTGIVTLESSMSDSLPVTPASEAAHKIRRAATTDYAAVRRLFCIIQDDHAARLPDLFRPFEDGDFSEEHFARHLGDGQLLLLAEHKGVAVGTVHAKLVEMNFGGGYRPYKSMFVTFVVVDPSMRQRGIARSLMAALAEWGRLNGAERIDLSVWRTNEAAIALYRNLGFGESYVGMMGQAGDVLARCGSGWLPQEKPQTAPRLPSWLSRMAGRRA
jgi:ribosomal protein S18 acetylase RimI-like enzyme